ncbi:hypothetical protein HaLaN_06612 [Haematococcus lacustris]|uniref:Uncharacterized protein n=1 Tax=Haematococcus lacustris TaxID=44745 RepID=A0A699YNM2_HAELA|nr:hypothetical protein HaLaN_06612 [Haematococcus lacustris]
MNTQELVVERVSNTAASRKGVSQGAEAEALPPEPNLHRHGCGLWGEGPQEVELGLGLSGTRAVKN